MSHPDPDTVAAELAALDAKPYGSIDPNSTHQLWSRWVFGIQAHRSKQPTPRQVVDEARRFFKQLFRSSVGRARCDQQGLYYSVVLEIEGPAAHDPGLRREAIHKFAWHFVATGFGPSARLVRFDVGVLSGDQQDGKPPEQMLVMPAAIRLSELYPADRNPPGPRDQGLGLPAAIRTTRLAYNSPSE